MLRRGLHRAEAASLGLAAFVFVVVMLRSLSTCACRSLAKDASSDTIKIQAAVEQYWLNHGRCPQDVAAMLSANVLARFPRDPWGRPYAITCTGEEPKVRVCSHGQVAGDPADDVCSDPG